jgi:hypothetical protein
MTQKSQSEPVAHNSLGLQALCQRLQDVTRCDILELGPARSGNIQFWSQWSPSIYVADLRASLPLPALPSENPDAPGYDWAHILDLPGNRGFDVILTWDLFNYLDLTAISGLIRYLRCFCRPDTVLLTMIYDQKQMPDEITVYRIKDDAHLIYENSFSKMRDCPRHQPRALSAALGQFRTSNSFRLRNGIIEYLFVYEGEKND